MRHTPTQQKRRATADGLSVFAPDALPGVRLLQFRGAHRFHSYYNEVYTVVAVFRSRAEVAFRGKTYAAKGGEVGLLAPDGIFRHVNNPIPEFIGKLQIDPSILENNARELGVRGAHVHFGGLLVRAPALFEALSILHSCILLEPTPLELQTAFNNCLRLFIEQRMGGTTPVRIGTEPGAVRRARDLLHARYSEKVTLDDLAIASGVSVHHLPRLFAREVGLPPHAYQTHLRLAQARRLLASGMPLSKAAAEVGFTDQSHLARHFRRTLGFTPGAYSRSSPIGPDPVEVEEGEEATVPVLGRASPD